MFPPNHSFVEPDAGIRSTDTDASLARLSAVKKGYLTDPYVHLFVPRAQFQTPRAPLINIGTAVRTESLDRLIQSWLDRCQGMQMKGQIVSLGAGNDTRFWRLADSKYKDSLSKYIELDFTEITSKKSFTIDKKKELKAHLGDTFKILPGGVGLVSQVYSIVPGDLRKPSESFEQLVEGDNPLLNHSLPTLLLFECVLAYMEPSQSEDVISWFTTRFSNTAPLGVVIYEMFGLNDRFGQVMKTNLQSSRSIQLPGVEPFQSKEDLEARFTALGFSISRAITLEEIRLNILPRQGQDLLDREGIDEVEELDLVLDHYAISWAQMCPPVLAGSNDSAWDSWRLAWDTQQ